MSDDDFGPVDYPDIEREAIMSEGEADPTVSNLAAAASKKNLLRNKDGAPKRSLANVLHTFVTHPAWDGVLAWDEFGQCVVTRRRPPMRPQDEPSSYTVGDWTDEDTTRTVAWFASEVGFEPTRAYVDDAAQTAAKKNVVHPVRDWLASLEWDGTPRIDDFVHAYLGGPSGAYSAAVGRRWLISAVARVYRPGAKVDSMLALEGSQGIGKSSALRLLAGAPWFADTGIELGNKDSYQALRRKWVYEFAELSSIRAAKDVERVKAFLSSQVDTYRPSYGRRAQDVPRQVVFAGSTNDSAYLTDPTGARRVWPVACTTIDLSAIERDREQLWAEARDAYLAGEPWHLDTELLRELAAAEQAERHEQDDWLPIVVRWVKDPTIPDPIHREQRERVSLDNGITTGDVLLGALGFDAGRIKPGDSKRVGHVLRALGFFPRQVREGTSRIRRYFRTSDETSDTGASQKQPLSHVTPEICDPRTQGRGTRERVSDPRNQPVTPVTRDNGRNHA